jgi:hypothetical protein
MTYFCNVLYISKTTNDKNQISNKLQKLKTQLSKQYKFQSFGIYDF